MKRIYRSRQDRMVCGVCGGIAEYFDLDPSLVRLGWIISLLWEAVALLLIFAAIVIPSR